LPVTAKGSSSRSRGSGSPDKAARIAIIAASGGYWTLGFAGATFPLKDFKGLSYIQRMLKHPGEEFHSLDLLSGPGGALAGESDEPNLRSESSDDERGLDDDGVRLDPRRFRPRPEGTDSVGGLGDAGALLDPQAKQAYRRGIVELEEQLEDLRERGKHERADEVETKLDFLRRELARAVGLSGRDRRAGSAAERARISVTRAINVAREKISKQHAEFAELLDRTIKTGSFCSYVPDPKDPVVWHFSPDGAKPAAEVPPAGPISSRRDTSFLRAFTEGTTFVAREEERATLLHGLEQAQRGQGKIFLIGGAAGEGKTRIAAEIAAEASRRGMLTFVGSCYDRDDPVPFIPFVEILEGALAQTRDPAAFRRALGDDASEVARLLPQLRRSFPDIPAAIDLPPEQSRRILFGAVTEMVRRVSRNTPALFLLDDLQWADEGTLLLLSHFAQFVPALPVMIVATHRDFEPDPTGHLTRTLDELIRHHLVERITLSGIPRSAVAEMLLALSGREPPDVVVRLFYSNTEGNPLFVEELFMHLREQGKLFDSAGEFRRELELDDVEVPQNLKLAIGRNLARLADVTLKALGAAAVIGRWFTFDLLAETTKAAPDSLLDCIEEAEAAGLISSTLQYPQAQFRFSHELIRQAVLARLSVVRRQRFHLYIADAIECLHPNALEDHANDLAHHLWHAGQTADSARTARFLAIAAKRAIQASAYDVAIRDLHKALNLVRNSGGSEAAARQELQLQQMIGSASMALNGYAASEVEVAFARARELCGRTSESAEVVPVLLGLWAFYLVRANYKTAHELADQVLRLAERYRDSSHILEGHLRLGVTLMYEGDVHGARMHLEQSLSNFDPELHQGNAYLYGQDPCVAARVYLGLALWRLGYPDQALVVTQQGLARAQQIAHPLTTAYAHCYAAWLHIDRREWDRVREHTEAMMAVSSEHGFPTWVAIGTVFLASAQLAEGRLAEAMNCAQQGLASWREIGAGCGTPGFLAFLATLHDLAQEPRIAFQRIEEAFAEAAASKENCQLPELYRIKAEMLARAEDAHRACVRPLDTNAQEASAQECFLKSIQIAQSQGTRSYELRAATGLGRLWKNRGQIDDAATMLSEIVGWFTEGLETVDLQEAKLLLSELSLNRR
jgi:predicted ATPase